MPKHETNPAKYLSDPRVAERYDVCLRTLKRWDENPEVEFPPAIVLRNRRYREVAALDAWDRANSLKAAKRSRAA